MSNVGRTNDRQKNKKDFNLYNFTENPEKEQDAAKKLNRGCLFVEMSLDFYEVF